MNKIIEDLSKITTIPETALTKLAEKAVWCICDSFEESILENLEVTEIDLGVGCLQISNCDENIVYRFIPSEILEKSLIDISLNNKNPLQLTLEKTLANKIINTYKDII